ncbi:SURF1 family protein [Thaumasiovibrio subtropicus]|uniref:SURF1 family protein n=1 Tax=Thaumasiovibrio subtropicus TaxID=1891207 RepID=UPI00131ABCF0|nr:SURF1 family protein [Thaumasiovibrio subtropicus]
MTFALFTLVAVALLVKLGMWQLSRAEEKARLSSQLNARSEQVYRDVSLLPEDAAFYRLEVEGALRGVTPIWLDNQIFQGRVGYQLLFPFQTADGWLLINLGWVAAPTSRDRLPTLPDNVSRAVEKSLKVSGLLSPPSANVVLAEKTDERFVDGIRVQRVDIADLAARLDISLLPYLLHIDGAHPIAQQPIWQPTVMSAQKHIGYAVQWFLMSLAVAVSGFIWLRRSR